jgi:hypothetical protein
LLVLYLILSFSLLFKLGFFVSLLIVLVYFSFLVRGFRLLFLLGCVILVYLRLLFLLGCVILVYVNLFYTLASKPINAGLNPLKKQFIIIIGFV